MNAFLAKVLAIQQAIGAQLPGMLTAGEADIATLEAAVVKILADGQSDLNALIAAAKAAS